jgi:flagellum-specific ATP synthase
MRKTKMVSMSLALEKLESQFRSQLNQTTRYQMCGRVQRAAGLVLEASGITCCIGSRCILELPEGHIPAEVIGFSGTRTFLMPLAPVRGVFPGARVVPDTQLSSPACQDLLGRVVDGLGRPLDGRPLARSARATMTAEPINPLDRRPIDEPIDVGVRSINALLKVGVGQRVGLFAGSGVGKSVLLGMLARFTNADVVVVGLIGERGREVKEFVDDNLGSGISKSVVVASPADDSPAMRLRGAALATEVAEAFRAQGKRVLLLMDSLTRVAQAQREIGLAMGEPTTAKGYTPSVFSLLPRLVERSGQTSNDRGSITAFYTVLMEEDDLQDPVVDSARAILDGHFVLSRRLADRGHYPAIDIEASVSRLMNKLASADEWREASRFRELWSRYAEQEDLINVGAYQAGSDPDTDQAIELHDRFRKFLRQSPDERIALPAASAELSSLFAERLPTPAVIQGGLHEQE